MMEEQAVDEQQFKDILVMWHRVGRGLITLPRITPTSKGIQIGVVSIDSTVVFIYKHLFKSYKALLTWYGELLNNCSK